MADRERFQTLLRQAEAGDRLRIECRRKGVRIVAVERAMGLSETTLNRLLSGQRLWTGDEDFELAVLGGISKAINEREQVSA